MTDVRTKGVELCAVEFVRLEAAGQEYRVVTNAWILDSPWRLFGARNGSAPLG